MHWALKYIIVSYVCMLLLLIVDYVASSFKYYKEMIKYISNPTLNHPIFPSTLSDFGASGIAIFIFSPLTFIAACGILIGLAAEKIGSLCRIISLNRWLNKRLFKKYKALVVTHPDERIRNLKDQ